MKLEKIQKRFFDVDKSIHLVLFNIITLAGIGGGILGLIVSVACKLPLVQLASIAAALLVLITCFYIANWKGKLKQASTGIVVIITMLLFPAMFFTDGGAYGGMGYWFTLGIVFNFLMVEGAAFSVILVLQIIVILCCYWVAYLYPQLVVPIGSEANIFIDILQSRIILGLVVGVIYRFQTKVYRKALHQIEKQNEELKRSEEKADKANQAKSDFLSNMSHEIRTPINAVIGMNEMILREAKEEQLLEYATAVQNSALALLSIINDVLDISKIEAGKIEISEARYELSSLLTDSYTMIIDRAESRGLEFEVCCEESIPAFLLGDMVRIRQILANLLTNAVKYTDHGKIRLCVTGEYEDGIFYLTARVEDTGIGISEENRERLFGKFERFDLVRNQSIEGTGLGLSITKELVELMHGTIEAESEYGVGSVFTVRIPQKVLSDQPIGSFDIKKRIHSREGQHYESRFTAPAARILVVDDVAMNLKVFVNLLKETQIEIDTAQSGAECIALATKRQYDIIFMDHMMPQLNGIDTLKALRERPDNLNMQTPVVMLTANALSGVEEMYLKEGFSAYLSKPVRGKNLEEMVLRFLPGEKVIKAGAREKKEKKDPLLSLQEKVPELDTQQGLLYCAGDQDFYLEILKDYCKNDKTEKLRALWKAGELENYRVEIHGLKSTSKTIGLTAFSQQAKEIEDALKEGRTTQLSEKCEELLLTYAVLKKNIENALDIM